MFIIFIFIVQKIGKIKFTIKMCVNYYDFDVFENIFVTWKNFKDIILSEKIANII